MARPLLARTNAEVLAELQYAIPRVDHLRFTIYTIDTGTTIVFVPTVYAVTAETITIETLEGDKKLTITLATGEIAMASNK